MTLTDRPAPDGPRKSRFPAWMRKRIPAGGKSAHVREALSDLHLNTVCNSAMCPNIGECFSCGTATFMILGGVCTRNCGFCAVPSGRGLPLEADEPERVAEAAARLKLKYVVITSVTRDDLPDGGAEHYRRTIEAVKKQTGARLEVLTPDFLGQGDCVDTVLSAQPAVYNHNVETVPRLYPLVRPQAVYERSLEVIRRAGSGDQAGPTKSGLMLGLGEKADEVEQVLRDLRGVGCRILTIGQYLSPSSDHLPIVRFVPPEEFDEWGAKAREMGFTAVASGPFVRSSYHAAEFAPNLESD